MRLVRVGLGSIDTTVGAFRENTDRALALAHDMAADGVTVGVFPEQAIGGYPVEDLIQWQGFVERQWPELERFAGETASLATVFVVGVSVLHDGLRYNCAATIAGGSIRSLTPKEKLPTYNVFYEGRTVSRGVPGAIGDVRGVPFGDLVVRFDFGTIAPEVCEDLWSPEGPTRRRTYSGAELVCNVSASPFRLGVVQTRRELIATRAADYQCTFAYANMVGANDGLIFDGGGYLNQNGKWMLEAPRWREGFAAATVDLDRTTRLRAENTTWRIDAEAYLVDHAPVTIIDVPSAEFSTAATRAALTYPVPAHGSFFLPEPEPRRSPREEFFQEILDALTMGIGDYFEKNPVFRLIGVALSGGRDSLLTLLIAHRYASRVRPDDPGSLLRAFYMPSRHSSAETRRAAETICHELAKQNIQARIRGQRMWNWSNSSGGLFLQTGNMSERAVGYTTIGGDLEGALGVLANVPKTVVMALLTYLQEQTGYEGIGFVLARPAGPELAPDQEGEKELMPFPVLDACFHLFAAEKLLPEEVAETLVVMFPAYTRDQLRAWVEKFTRLFLGSID